MQRPGPDLLRLRAEIFCVLIYIVALMQPFVSTWSKTNPIESLVYASKEKTSRKSQGC
jgi:hypothetical protein